MQGFTREEKFELPVRYKGMEIMVPGRLVQAGYSYKMYMSIGDTEIIFEPDEERNFRALAENIPDWQVDIHLIRAIGEALEENFR